MSRVVAICSRGTLAVTACSRGDSGSAQWLQANVPERNNGKKLNLCYMLVPRVLR